MSGDSSSATKDFVVTCGDIKGSVGVEENDTLAEVRTLLEEEFDEDMLPSVPWVYWVDGSRLSAKQEARRLAFSVRGKQVELRPKGQRPSEATTDYNSDHLPTTSNKRQQLDNYASASTSASTSTCPSTCTRRHGVPLDEVSKLLSEAKAEANVHRSPGVGLFVGVAVCVWGGGCPGDA